MCGNGIGAIGCGPQEEFRSCSDIALTTEYLHPYLSPINPPPSQSNGMSANTKHNTVNIQSYKLKYICIILLLLILILVCVVVMSIKFHNHNSFCIPQFCNNQKKYLFWNSSQHNNFICDLFKKNITLSNDKLDDPVHKLGD